MSKNVIKVIWFILGAIVFSIALSVLLQSHRAADAKQAFENTRRQLRAEGFKTAPADFDTTNDPATQARTEVLVSVGDPFIPRTCGEQFNLLPWVSDDTSAQVWKGDSLDFGTRIYQWADLHAMLDTNKETLDNVCEVAISDAISIDVDAEPRTRFEETRYLLFCLSQTLCCRAMLEMHDGHHNAAWTNLVSATQLVTARKLEPDSFSHIQNAEMLGLVFEATWQMMQGAILPDDKLSFLQAQWESVDLFSSVSETAEFDCADVINNCKSQIPLPGDDSLSVLLQRIIHEPRSEFADLRERLKAKHYRDFGMPVDQKNVLLYFRTYELDLARAMKAETWIAMRSLPGITNLPPYKIADSDLDNYLSSVRQEEFLMLYDVVESEARRRILITAIALERYRGRHGAYPSNLTALVPEFLKSISLDFMDGQPLRYRLTGDGHFVLYSVGFDCIDDGGRLPNPDGPEVLPDKDGYFPPPTNEDIVWPRPNVVGTQLEPKP